MIASDTERNPVTLRAHGLNFGCSTLETLPSDAFGEIVGALNLDTLINFMAISKLVRQRLEEPSVQPGLARHVPEIYRTHPMLVEMIQKVWQSMGGMILECPKLEWPKIEVGARGSPKTPEYLDESDEYRCSMRFRLLKVLKERLKKWVEVLQMSYLTPGTNSIPQDMIIDCIAIETLLVNYGSRVLDEEDMGLSDERWERHDSEEMGKVDTLAIPLFQLKDYFSPRLFRILLRESRFLLLDAFFSFLDERVDEEEKKAIARFLLTHCDGFLLGMQKCDCPKIENLLGVELETLSIEYKIFGSHWLGEGETEVLVDENTGVCKKLGSHGLGETEFFGGENTGFQCLCGFPSVCEYSVDQTGPLDKDGEHLPECRELCHEFVGHLVRVGKYIFAGVDELKHFLLVVLREARKTLFLEASTRRFWGPSIKLCQETTTRFENLIEGTITRAIADDTTPFCVRTEQNTKFVYDVLVPYLVAACTEGG